MKHLGPCPWAALAGMALAAAAAAAAPIPPGPPSSLPDFSGARAVRQPVRGIHKPPRNPFMARNGKSNVHDDPWMSDVYWARGPVGASPETRSVQLLRICITVTFDHKGRIVATCSTYTGPHLFLFDPDTLDVLAEYALPFVPPPAGTDPTQNTAGGAYFYLDQHDRAVVAVSTGHILVIGETTAPLGFVQVADYDLSAVMGDDRITSTLPDWQGRLWFVGRYHGIVGVLDPRSGTVHTMRLDEEVENSFAMDRDAAYIVSDKAMYRFGVDATGSPTVVWSATYDNVGIQKPGQFNAGSGTTPTVLPDGYVAITDNADPMQVVVYRTAATLPAGVARQVCAVPVFDAGESATENSVIGAGRALIVENNYGYSFAGTIDGALTSPGITRVDIDADGNGCHVVWTNTAERAPSVVPKLSLGTGLVYVFTKDPDPADPTLDVWSWTALDFRTGTTVWKRIAGTGQLFDNHYSGIVLSPDGHSAYVGALGGLLGLHDVR